MAAKLPTAVAYLRTSSAANVGADKDSVRRQQEAIEAYAARRYQITAAFYDAAISGADPIDARPGFVELLDHCQEYDVVVVLVENASRFARDLPCSLPATNYCGSAASN